MSKGIALPAFAVQSWEFNGSLGGLRHEVERKWMSELSACFEQRQS